MSKLDILRKIIGKTATVVEPEETWVGEVVDVKDENTVLVKEQNIIHEVDIFNIRSTT